MSVRVYLAGPEVFLPNAREVLDQKIALTKAAGLMTARSAEALDAEMQAFYKQASKVTWMYAPTALNLWKPGFPDYLVFATLTCAPWRWVLVAPSKLAPNGFVNVQTGATHEVVW